MKFKVLVVLALLFLFVGSATAQTFNVIGNWSLVRDSQTLEWREEVNLGASSASSFAGRLYWRASNRVIIGMCDISDGILRSDNSLTFSAVCGTGQNTYIISIAGRPTSDDTITGTWYENGPEGEKRGTFVMKRQ
jgi:hypothetical protein